MFKPTFLAGALIGLSGCFVGQGDFPRDNPNDPEFEGQALCSDGVENGDESDIDCGGGSCTGCADQLGCDADSDCARGVCGNGRCQGCGDGLVWPDSEQCDDANSTNGDGCTGCAVETGWNCNTAAPSLCGQCGDGALQAEVGEECDDTSDPYCSPSCQLIGSCGDGTVQPEALEECDDAGPSSTCNRNCRFVCNGLCVVGAAFAPLSATMSSGTLSVVEAAFERADRTCDGDTCVVAGGLTASTGEQE